jgi:deoxyribose-phosphate aldolase
VDSLTLTREEFERLVAEVARLSMEVAPQATDPRSTCQCRTFCTQMCPDRLGNILAHGADRIGMHVAFPGTAKDLARYIDHTLLKADATYEEIDRLCAEARQHGFASVCVNPVHVRRCAESLRGSPVLVCAVVGFPLGATLPDEKAYEARRCLAEGAREIDMVINVGALKSGDDALVRRDIEGVVAACHEAGAATKVILETCLLSEEEKVRACRLAKEAGADFVKTSTGFASGGATPEDVELMRRVVGPGVGVKAAGGVRDLETAMKMIRSGATRIGASAGVRIVREATGEKAAPASATRGY